VESVYGFGKGGLGLYRSVASRVSAQTAVPHLDELSLRLEIPPPLLQPPIISPRPACPPRAARHTHWSCFQWGRRAEGTSACCILETYFSPCALIPSSARCRSASAGWFSGAIWKPKRRLTSPLNS
ncbi:hypothetical protein KUCAC02_001240, partial [Chaenocephalus aceratus]